MNFSAQVPHIPNVRTCTTVTLSPEMENICMGDTTLLERLQQNSREVDISRITYHSQAHAVVGFVIEPKVISQPLPCIIYNRGGSGEFGKIKQLHLFGTLSEIAKWGYIVIASQYSGNDGGEGQDEFGGKEVADIEALYSILQFYSNADISRIGMMGGSRGGMMTYLMLARVQWIKAAVVRAGLTNLFRNQRDRYKMKKHHIDYFGGGKVAMKERSALYWPEKFPKDVPLLMMHGTSDWRVNPLDSLDLSRKLLKYSVPHRLVLFEGAQHSLQEVYDEVMSLTKSWFDTYVKEGAPLPNMELHGK